MCRGRVAGVSGRVPGVSGCVAGVWRVCRGCAGGVCQGCGVRGWMEAVCPGVRDPPPSPGRSLLRVSSTRVVPYFVCRFPRGPLGTSRAERFPFSARELRVALRVSAVPLFRVLSLRVSPGTRAAVPWGRLPLFPGESNRHRRASACRRARRTSLLFAVPVPTAPQRTQLFVHTRNSTLLHRTAPQHTQLQISPPR